MPDFSLTGDYATVKADAQVAYERALANIAATRNATNQRYGYNPDGSVSGNVYGDYLQLLIAQAQANPGGIGTRATVYGVS